MAKKTVLVAFGGVSAEHEVSIITGLQVLEAMDRDRYEPYCVYVAKDGRILGYPGVQHRSQFAKASPKLLTVGKDERGGFLRETGLTGKKISPAAAYFAFHGGTGESGPMQGLCEALDIPFTSSGQEGSVIVMNKALSRQVLGAEGLPVVKGVSVMSADVIADVAATAKRIVATVPLPVIIKPVHLGSSIGISIAKTDNELERFLLEAAHVDQEIVVEELLTGFKEYNCAVRAIGGAVETSEIESPVAKDAILSFADKYQRGGKKTGDGGMASLQRELPAKIDAALRDRIMDTAKRAFVACRCKGMARIDFMVTGDGTVYITEINPIPGSMAFYLWEAKGIPFTQQITDMVEQAIADADLARG
ncbi:hypothetical protein HYS28_00975, partial [Candidatus Uhrbacteria bacterium]|nr:hypothetical protein [Candidatus Uhrbacteria bacterium]